MIANVGFHKLGSERSAQGVLNHLQVDTNQCIALVPIEKRRNALSGLWQAAAIVIGIASSTVALHTWRSSWAFQVLVSGALFSLVVFFVALVLEVSLTAVWDKAARVHHWQQIGELTSHLILTLYSQSPEEFATLIMSMSQEERLHLIEQARTNAMLSAKERNELLAVLGSEPIRRSKWMIWAHHHRQAATSLSFKEASRMIRSHRSLPISDETDQ
jgi:hypothetical protein